MSSNTSSKSKKQKVEGKFFANDPMLQCASYVLEILSHSGLWSHGISAIMTDDTIELLYYDRLIITTLEPLNFVKDFPRFITFLHAIAVETE